MNKPNKNQAEKSLSRLDFWSFVSLRIVNEHIAVKIGRVHLY
jgi:hypothetical protein